MVPFVPGFVSPALHAHGVLRSAVAADARRRLGADTAAVSRELSAWGKTHPAPHATLKDVADQIDYIRKVAGVDHIGIGSDFDGVDDDLPDGLQDQAAFPALFAELIMRGWSDRDLKKLAGENVLRALGTAEQVAKRLQKSRAARTKTIL
jgi:membrane dipeptidase